MASEEKLITNENYNVVEVTLRVILVDNEEPLLSKLTIQPKLKEVFDKSEIISIKDIDQKCFNIPYIFFNGQAIDKVYECSGKYFRKDGTTNIFKEFVPFKHEGNLFVTFESSMFKLFENTLENMKHLEIELSKINIWTTPIENKLYYYDLPKTLPLLGETNE